MICPDIIDIQYYTVILYRTCILHLEVIVLLEEFTILLHSLQCFWACPRNNFDPSLLKEIVTNSRHPAKYQEITVISSIHKIQSLNHRYDSRNPKTNMEAKHNPYHPWDWYIYLHLVVF